MGSPLFVLERLRIFPTDFVEWHRAILGKDGRDARAVHHELRPKTSILYIPFVSPW
jgi:hypothetical protein